jgi:hypothetical protein
MPHEDGSRHACLDADEEFEMSDLDTTMELTVELASQLAVVAVTVDVDLWARTIAAEGQLALQDLTRPIDAVRRIAGPPPDAHDSADQISLLEARVCLR